ncbi:MAG: VWA domain-containing protein [Elusimicrobiota bacterium]|jgi:Ca-activated chloride channel family protein|nr:VWA domain-containing protein [Elusimicrobiota bacterium]
MNKHTFLKYLIYGIIALIAVAVLCALAWLLLQKYSFANPALLWLFAPAAALCIAAAFIRHFLRPALKYPLPAGCKTRFSIAAAFANWLSFALCCAALFLCLIALARPRTEGKTVIPPAKGIDIMMVIDISNSMSAVDFEPDRLGAAKNTALNFIKKRASDRIGIVLFEDFALLQCPLTLDYFAAEDYIKNIRLGMLGGMGGTAIGDGIAAAAAHLKNSAAKSKIIILLTDGESNTGVIGPMPAAKAAQSYGLKIYTIAMTSDGTARLPPAESLLGRVRYMPIEPMTKEAEALLLEIAKMTGGEFYRARNTLELETIYSKIDALEKTEFEEAPQINYIDEYHGFLVWAVVLLVIAFVCDKFIFIKIP